MTWVDWLVLAAYASLVVELTVFPVPSEASTLQLLTARDRGEVSAGDALGLAQARPAWQKLVLYLVPTAACVALFLVPPASVLLPGVGRALGVGVLPAITWPGVVLVVAGRVLTFTSMLQLHRRRGGAAAPRGPFAWSRNPGIVGMVVFYVGLCCLFGAWLLWFGLLLYVANMHHRVRMEEAHLAAADGRAWAEYAARVPRYFGRTGGGGSAPEVDQAGVAAWFDATYRSKGFGYLRPFRAYPIFVQLVGGRAGDHLLDVACGPGLVLRAAGERGLLASGVDISREAVELARRHVPAADARVGNAESLPFADGVFDRVTCLGSLERFLDRERALREMLRVAAPDARFCFLVRNASTLVWRVWRQGMRRRELAAHQDAMTLDAWRELFARCGFAIDRVLPDQWPRQRWRQLLPGGRPAPGRDEPLARGILPLGWHNELVFVLRRATVAP
ncbi:MAG: methyltransferase domain-containing protein [Planctomycetota bacterium]